MRAGQAVTLFTRASAFSASQAAAAAMRCAWRRSSRNSSSAAGPNLAPHGSTGSVRCLKYNAAGSVLGPHTPLLAEPLRNPRVKVVLAGAAGLTPVLCAEASAVAAHAVIRGPAPRVPQHLPGARGQAHLLHRPLQTCCPDLLQSCCPDLLHKALACGLPTSSKTCQAL